MKKLVLVRHGESEWNKLNLFTGWTDVGLSENGIKEAKFCGETLKKENYDFDVCYVSYLKRAIDTLNIVLEQMDREWLPVSKAWQLNERHYGALQGLNKSETAEKYGEDQVQIWRRSYDVYPPLLKKDDKRAPYFDIKYAHVDKAVLPLAESLEATVKRVVPYFEENIVPQIKDNKRVLIVAHGNSLRALVKFLENMSDEEITKVNIPTGVPLVYELSDDLKVLKKYYLGNQEAIESKMNQVAHQGAVKK